MHQNKITIRTEGRGTIDITSRVQEVVREASVERGLCHVFNHHTSASLMLCENADATVRSDLEAWMQRAVPDGDPLFEHVAEGPDDMPAHVRTLLTHSSLTIPVTAGRCALGRWQGIYLWEHRRAPHTRSVTVTVFSG
ncbi:MAG: secondary thiamine-phosphate synthase enzyme YjbQ [Gammaproteobacteria bacterium]